MRALNVQLSPSDYESMAWWFLESVLLYLTVEAEYRKETGDKETESTE